MLQVGRRTLVVALALALGLVGCTPTETDNEVADNEVADSEEATEPDDLPAEGTAEEGLDLEATVDQLPSDVELPDLDGTPVAAGLVWVLDGLAADEPPATDEIELAFADVALAQVPAAQLQDVFAQLAGEYRITQVEQANPASFTGEIDDGGTQRWRLVLEMSATEPAQIETLFFGTPVADPASFDSWDEVEDALGQGVSQMSYLAAEVSDGACEPIASADPGQAGPVASVAKLYVLGAVADAVEAGELAWDDELEVTDELRSLPSGQLQDADEGTLVTVEQAAEMMIAISDNTATDLLIDAVGRSAVEEALGDYGHAAPELNEPFVTTQELFKLKWQVDEQTRQDYAQSAGFDRRQILEELAQEPLTVSAQEVIGPPVEPSSIGWFASPEDLCEVLVELGSVASDVAPVAEALSANPIVRLGDTWTDSASKGGSEPGVLAFSWLLERGDGREFVFAALFTDDIPIDELAVIPNLEGALDLLAETGE